MFLFVIAYLGGILTIVSPCILPVLPFVFIRANQSFLRSGLPMLLGMAMSFALVASLITIAGGWVVAANQYGRLIAMIILVLFALTLLFPNIATKLTAPFVQMGNHLAIYADGQHPKTHIWGSALLGVATGLLWAPCAGPILGLILTGAALNGANLNTTILLFCYALGAATSLAIILLIGGRLVAALKHTFGFTQWVKRALGLIVLCAVGVIATGLDTGYLTQISLANTNKLEQKIMGYIAPSSSTNIATNNNPAMMGANPNMMMSGGQKPNDQLSLPVEGQAPDFDGANQWLNSAPLNLAQLKGKVILVDFWTYSCINCLRAIPYVRAWAEKYKDKGLVVIGVHSPEFAFERDINNVKNAVKKLNISYPVAIDNHYAIWRAYNNQYWPAHYFIDAKGKIRHHHFGEGDYDQSEKIIQNLLAEAGETNIASDIVAVQATGAQAPADLTNVLSPETYIGFERAQNFVSPEEMRENAPTNYSHGDPRLNEWSLKGNWTISSENATLNSQKGSIVFRFHARDLHLVLGPQEQGTTIAFKVTIDGKAPQNSHGSDINSNGEGVVKEQRLYQLIRQSESDSQSDHLFEIEFLQPGVKAYAFTFG